MRNSSGVYKITNTVSGDFYIGSTKHFVSRWSEHRRPTMWKIKPNNRMYKDMSTIGVDKFVFEILEECPCDLLRIREQFWIDKLKPTYNKSRAKYKDKKAINKKYNSSEKGREGRRKLNNRICIYEGKQIKFKALSNRIGYSAASKCLLKESA